MEREVEVEAAAMAEEGSVRPLAGAMVIRGTAALRALGVRQQMYQITSDDKTNMHRFAVKPRVTTS